MIPRTSSGRGFKGAAAYYLHDKGSPTTADRVRFTQTLNLANDVPRRAVAEMIYTAEHAGDLKASAGVKSTGRKLDKPVYTFSLSWHPSEKPTDDQMRDAASDALKALKMRDHQVLLIAHNDTEHPHIHLMVNRVHPNTGIAHPLNKDHMILSKWAEKYEKEHGKTWCLDRVKNNADRQHATFDKARGQAATAFVKDRKSQERDLRPEYDRRQAGIRAKTVARQAQNSAEAGHFPESPTILPANRFDAPRTIQPSPAALNRLQDKHNAEKDALLQRYEKRQSEANAQIEETYGEPKRRDEARLAEIKERQQKGSWLSRAVDKIGNLSDERDRLEKSLRIISMRSREILHPIVVEKQAAVAALADRQRQERRDFTPQGGDRRESSKTPDRNIERKDQYGHGRDFD